jgi:rhodanese-related sulfurtransferase
MLADPTRTTYVLDVRDPEEYAAGHLPGSRSAPGGQLVQATDQWIAVRGARVVLVDDAAFGAPPRDPSGAPPRDGVRARMAGGWLRLMGGWEVHVLEGGGPAAAIETGAWRPESPEAEAARPTAIAATELAAALERGEARVVQLSRSVDFREAHIPGALWGVRTRLAGLAPRLADARIAAIAAAEEPIGRLAAAELQAILPAGAQVRVLAGGLAAWRAAGLPMEADRSVPPDAECIDVYLRPYDRNEGVEAAMREYLSWEIDLVHEVERDGDARFGEAVPGMAGAGGAAGRH